MTAHAHAHGQHEWLLKLYAALLACSQTIIRCDQKKTLLDDICHQIVALGGMKAAWLGLCGAEDPSQVWPQAHAGDGLDYLQTLRLSMGSDAATLACDPVQLAMREDRVVWTQDLANDPDMVALHKHAQAHGWRAAAALPLRLAGKPVGVLCLYADQVNGFDAVIRDLLAQLASNISHALGVFENDAQRRQVEFALQESEVRYSALFANSCMPMMILDPANGNIVDANILALDFYGWDKASFTSMKIMDVNTLTPEQVRLEMAQAAAARRSFFEFRHRLASGEVRDVEVFSRPVTFDGKAYLMSAIHDVSQRRVLQAQVRSTQALTQSFIDHLPGVAFVKDSDLRLTLVNRQLGDLLGVPAQTLIGKTAHDIFPPELADELAEMDREVLAQGGSKSYDQAFDGRHSEATLFAIQDDAGQRYLGGLILDVTDRYLVNERTHAMLRLSQMAGVQTDKQLLREGLQAARAITQSKLGFLHFVSPDQASLELVTWTAGDLAGDGAEGDACSPTSQAGLWADCLRQQQPVIFNDQVNAQAPLPGQVPLQRLVSVPVMDGGRPSMLMGVGNKAADYDQRDVETLLLLGNAMWRIVSRQRAERALQQRVQELSDLNRDLAATQLQLLQSEKMASIGQLAAGVAHEINNPIGFVKSNLGTLADYVDKLLGVTRSYAKLETCLDAMDDRAREQALHEVRRDKADADFDFMLSDLPTLIAESREGVERVGKIVMDLKNFSRVGETDFQWTDLHLGLESTINMVWNEIKYKADVKREYADLPPVYCVASQINQVMMNLLVNAAHAIGQRGHITVRSGVDGAQVWLEVQDSGEGMDATTQARIFEPFFTTKPIGKGTGLGLSIAMGIVKQHHGMLSVQSAPGQGSTFRVTLPINGGRDVVPPGSRGPGTDTRPASGWPGP